MTKTNQPSGIQKPDKKELQMIWDKIIDLSIKSEAKYTELGDTFAKFQYNGKTYKIEIKEVK